MNTAEADRPWAPRFDVSRKESASSEIRHTAKGGLSEDGYALRCGGFVSPFSQTRVCGLGSCTALRHRVPLPLQQPPPSRAPISVLFRAALEGGGPGGVCIPWKRRTNSLIYGYADRVSRRGAVYLTKVISTSGSFRVHAEGRREGGRGGGPLAGSSATGLRGSAEDACGCPLCVSHFNGAVSVAIVPRRALLLRDTTAPRHLCVRGSSATLRGPVIQSDITRARLALDFSPRGYLVISGRAGRGTLGQHATACSSLPTALPARAKHECAIKTTSSL
ncbi:hypothetical protein AAFF_G00141730 [Aldrovandia affinis]|uniref:Uncharacterized protein n=1 Tax=Aldrovandia affinis TaxID=143900 RepID=A0AAD7TCL1_9TELE|nr:hypothetical protein AAFF_G00141730 [Aldrovandia affinis]